MKLSDNSGRYNQSTKTPPLQSHTMYLVGILEILCILTPFQPSINLCIFEGSLGGELSLLKMLRTACLKYVELQD